MVFLYINRDEGDIQRRKHDIGNLTVLCLYTGDAAAFMGIKNVFVPNDSSLKKVPYCSFFVYDVVSLYPRTLQRPRFKFLVGKTVSALMIWYGFLKTS